MTRDINGNPASTYDSSRISEDVRTDLGKLDGDKAARIRAVADAAQTVRPQTWEEHAKQVKAGS